MNFELWRPMPLGYLQIFHKGRKPIGCKWIFKTKFDANGSLDKHKARFVLLGCPKKKKGIDYKETSALWQR